MASSADIAARLGAGWEYDARTRGYRNTATGQTLSRRQADKRYGALAAGGYTSYERKAAGRRVAGIPVGPARGRRAPPRRFRALVVGAGGEVRSAVLEVDRRAAARIGRWWNRVDQATQDGDSRPLRPWRNRPIVDAHGQRWYLVTDVDALYAFFESLTDAEQNEFWRTLYRRGEVALGSAA